VAVILFTTLKKLIHCKKRTVLFRVITKRTSTDISGHPIGPIFKSQESKKDYGINITRCIITQKSAVLMYFMAEA
jgi:hypothetical protein